jgi:hypothetical protein
VQIVYVLDQNYKWYALHNKNIQQTPSVSFYIASSPVKMASVKILAAPLDINLAM